MDGQQHSAPETSQINDWRSILVLVVFLITNVVVSFPFHLPVPIPYAVGALFTRTLRKLGITPAPEDEESRETERSPRWMFLRLHVSTVMAPLYAVLFLLATVAIGRQELYDGIIGANGIETYDVMIFFITLAYVAISIDASGLLRYLAFRVLQKGGGHGRRLFLYLYWFFSALGTAIGNDPIVLSGTAFLAYMIRGSSNIQSARAWIFSQFAVANISSAILVSSNPVSLVLAGAFRIRFVDYTANMAVPVVITAMVLFPCLLFLLFRNERFIPRSIATHELSEAEKIREPVNPNIPFAGAGGGHTNPVAEILNPYLDKRHAIMSCTIMLATLTSVLIINAVLASQDDGKHIPVIFVSMPAAALCLSLDLFFGWRNRHETRKQAALGRLLVERQAVELDLRSTMASSGSSPDSPSSGSAPPGGSTLLEKPPSRSPTTDVGLLVAVERELELREQKRREQPVTLVSKVREWYAWWRATFPAASAVLSRLPFPLVPFAFSMVILVEALVSKGWVAVFGYGWTAWIDRTGVVGAIGGMAFLGVFLSNAWQQILSSEARTVSDRIFWGGVYSMALGVNYGAFSAVLCASLAGLLWQNILLSKGVLVRSLEFFRVNIPIIGIATAVGCAVMVGEVYIIRTDEAYVM